MLSSHSIASKVQNRTSVRTGITSAADGTVSIANLGSGNYVLVETKAPTGYLINTEEIEFSIVATATSQPDVVEIDSFTNYKASATFTKVNELGTVLSGADLKFKTQLVQS